jgi:hypothetical protein
LGGPRRGCAASCRHRSPPDLVTRGGPEFYELYQHLAADRTRYNLTYGLRLRWSFGLGSDGLKGKNGVSLRPSKSIRSADKKRRRSSRLFPEGLGSETDLAGLRLRRNRSRQLLPLIETNGGLRFHLLPHKLLKNFVIKFQSRSVDNWKIGLIPSIFLLIVLGQAHRAGTTTGPSLLLDQKTVQFHQLSCSFSGERMIL